MPDRCSFTVLVTIAAYAALRLLGFVLAYFTGGP